jgi:hypothetical protein
MPKITKKQSLIMVLQCPDWLEQYQEYLEDRDPEEYEYSLEEFIEETIKDEKWIMQNPL